MKYRVSFDRPGGPVDLEVTLDAASSVADLATAIVRADPRRSFDDSHPLTLSVRTDRGMVGLPPHQLVIDSAVASGSTIGVAVAPDGVEPRDAAAAVAVLRIVSGPQQGQEFDLRAGSNYVGRDTDMDVVLDDPLVSKSHAKINIGDSVEIIDNNSSNGVVIGGVAAARSMLRANEQALLGDTVIEVKLLGRPPTTVVGSGQIPFVRSPRLAPVFEEETHPAPELPSRQDPQRFPLIALLTPLLLAAVLYSVTRSAATLLFVFLSPVMLLGQWAESKWSGKRQYRDAVKAFHASLAELGQIVRARQEVERASREAETPLLPVIAQAARDRTPLLWSRRPDQGDFLRVRLGTGADLSRVSIEMPTGRGTDPRLWEQLRSTVEQWRTIDSVPIAADLRECGAIGVSGSGEQGAAVSRALVMQAAALHSPAELVIATLAGSTSVDRWDWLKWLPHTLGQGSPVSTNLLTSSLGPSLALVTALEELLAERLEGASEESAVTVPSVLVVVEDDSPIERARLVALAETGRSAGIHVLWSAPRQALLPAACRAFVSLDDPSRPLAGFVKGGLAVSPLVVEPLSLPDVTALARSLAPVVDTAARADDASDLPRSVAFLALAGHRLVEGPDQVVERWAEAGSLAARRAPNGRIQPGTLRALVGQGPSGPLVVDLRTQGPHALVGGTTGAGKSELLQTWVLGMAAAHSPERVTFLFVDYKGGSAFGECVDLPHSVGLVTDLSPHLVRRALISLNAELKFREHLLNSAKAKDLEAMEKMGHPATPPSLVIVVDEFAALATDVPEFVDGVVNVAQRGRSLGLHLILATQRPTGVIKDNLRANTNLRLALRMADEADSTDILGTPAAASFDATAPGRAAAKIGSSRLLSFQTAYVGGHTSAELRPPDIALVELSAGGPIAWEPPAVESQRVDESLRTDLQRLVGVIGSASTLASVQPPRRPWLAELPGVIDLAELPTPRTDAQLVLGLQDVPEDQSQPVVTFDPDRDGNLAIFGTGGSGKSAALRSIACAAGFTVRGGPVHVYGLDFGARGLQMLEPLPHVGSIVSGEDTERVTRLLRGLRETVDQRAASYAAVQASSIAEYRNRADAPQEPRLILLLDGLAAFRQQHELGSTSGLFELLLSIAADGRPVGVHLVLTADRAATMPSSLGSLVSRRLVLRAADENDLAMLNVPKDLFSLQSPPGRGYLDGHEVQIAVLSGSSSVAEQSRAIERLAAAIDKHTQWPAPEPVLRLPNQVLLDELPILVGDRPAAGIEDATLAPVGMPTEGTFVVTGPPASGRSTTLLGLVRSQLRARPQLRLALFAPGRSDLGDALPWSHCVQDVDDAVAHAEKLISDLSGPSQARWIVVIENPGEFLNGEADVPLQDLVKAARTHGHLVLAEGDTQSMGGSWGLTQAVRYSRRGVILQPDQTDGENLFRTQFPRVKRADFPQGRGLLVADGRVSRVQMAMP